MPAAQGRLWRASPSLGPGAHLPQANLKLSVGQRRSLSPKSFLSLSDFHVEGASSHAANAMGIHLSQLS